MYILAQAVSQEQEIEGINFRKKDLSDMVIIFKKSENMLLEENGDMEQRRSTETDEAAGNLFCRLTAEV